jgi:hypothetical protein
MFMGLAPGILPSKNYARVNVTSALAGEQAGFAIGAEKW